MTLPTEPSLLRLPKIEERRGDLSFVEGGPWLPFEVEDAAWIVAREGGAHQAFTPAQTPGKQQVAIALHGRTTVQYGGRDFALADPAEGLYTGSAMKIADMQSGSVLAVLEGSQGYTFTNDNTTPDGLMSHAVSDVDRCRMIDIEGTETIGGAGSCGFTLYRWNESAKRSIEGGFDVRRIYYIYHASAGAMRGGHSHYRERKIIVAPAGRFNVTLDDGHKRRTFTLDDPGRVLFVPAGLWITVGGFSDAAVCMVLVDRKYDESDYVRNYLKFKHLTSHKKQ